ncbi:MAG: hypothetical protein AB7N65_31660 [Vicinamibacterales bacterium]
MPRRPALSRRRLVHLLPRSDPRPDVHAFVRGESPVVFPIALQLGSGPARAHQPAGRMRRRSEEQVPDFMRDRATQQGRR